MVLGVIVFIAVLAALLVFSLRETIQANIRDIFTNPNNPFYDFTETVLGIGLLFGCAFIFSSAASFLPQFDWNLIGWLILWFFIGSLILASVIFDFYTTHQNKLITKINIHNKKVQSVKDSVSLVVQYRQEFEKEIKLVDKLKSFFLDSENGILPHLAGDLDLPGSGGVFKKNEFNLFIEPESVLIDEDFETQANDPILTYHFKTIGNLGVEEMHILTACFHSDEEYSFFVLNSKETLFRVDIYATYFELKKFKPGQWTVFLIEKIDVFFNEIEVFQQKKREITRMEEEERKNLEKQELEKKIKEDFL